LWGGGGSAVVTSETRNWIAIARNHSEDHLAVTD
jgi:hypothetical protein